MKKVLFTLVIVVLVLGGATIGGVLMAPGGSFAQAPADIPNPTNTQVPTYTPIPTNTQVPTYTPIPINTQVPTYTPIPTNTQVPTYTPIIPTNTPSQPGATPTTSGGPTGDCTNIPADLEPLPRYVLDMAPLGSWFHPVYDLDKFQSSGGFEGQWSWYHTLCLIQGQGGQFLNFENNDGRFVFRVNQTIAQVSFTVLTTQDYRSQFMAGKDAFKSAMNIRTLPGTMIEIFDPRNGQLIGSQAVSIGGDLLIVTPDHGIVGVRFLINDPAASFEAQIWFGPDDRPGSNINRFDASSLVR